MEFRIEKAALVLIAAAAPLFAQDFAAKHQHAKGYCQGLVKITMEGVSYTAFAPEGQAAKVKKKPEKPHNFNWKFEDIQQLDVSPESLRILTYEDRKWAMGLDREVTFTGDFQRAYFRLQDRMDQRLVAHLADEHVQPLWTLPVKRLGRIQGTQGELLVGSDRIVYKSATKDASRTWRYSDIENISSSGPFQLTITTFERSKLHYGGAKGFNFQLKEALKEAEYNNLWRRLHQNSGLILMENTK